MSIELLDQPKELKKGRAEIDPTGYTSVAACRTGLINDRQSIKSNTEKDFTDHLQSWFTRLCVASLLEQQYEYLVWN